jgi:hypothetical protein
MRFVDSRCIHCGAAIRVADDAAHVRCQYCNSELHIVHDGEHSTTEVTRKTSNGVGQNLDVLRIQGEIERIDREWTLQRGSSAQPAKENAGPVAALFVGAILIVVGLSFGTLWVSVTLGNAPILFTAFGALVSLLFVVFGITAMVSAKSRGVATKEYQSTRQRLLDELANAQAGAQTDRR